MSSDASEAERIARASLSRIGEPGDPRLTGLVAELGGVKVWQALVQRSVEDVPRQRAAADLEADLQQRLATADGERELQRAGELGIRFVIPGDREWPRGVDDLAEVPVLHRRTGIPVGLWVKGPALLGEAGTRAVSVVGSRSATTYGADIAGGLAAHLGKQGWCVVSGAAFGIDQAAHRGALAVRAPTVAVLACGLDRAYPLAHRDLLEYIAQTGAIVSEAPIGFAPTRIRFLARNRIIAALSAGTVVVEAAIRSGALNTANWAGCLGRVVMGVPGPVTSAPSAGVHELIRSRAALLVTRGEEVVEAVSPAGEATLAEPRDEPNSRDALSDETRQVLDAVPVQRGVPAERIARTAGLRPQLVRRALTQLAAAGLVESAHDTWRLTPDPNPREPGFSSREPGFSSREPGFPCA